MNNLWNQIQVIKLRFQMGVLSRAGYIEMLNLYYTKAVQRQGSK